MKATTLGDVLARIRAARGWSLRRAEAATGIDHAHIGRIENGQREPSLTVLLRFSRGYGVTLKKILTDAGLI